MRGQSPHNLDGRRRKTTPQGEVGAGRVALLIRSRENEKLKLVRKLHDRRWRDKLGLFVAEGEDLVDAARNAGWEVVELLVAGENVEPALLVLDTVVAARFGMAQQMQPMHDRLRPLLPGAAMPLSTSPA